MNIVLTPAAAKELGRALRFMRHARSMTLRDVSRGAELSSQYVQNIESGVRTTVSEDAYERIVKALGVPDPVAADLVLRARLQSAFEQRGLDAGQVAFVWRGVEQRLTEQGFDMRTDLARVVAEMIGQQSPVEVQQKSTVERKRVVHQR